MFSLTLIYQRTRCNKEQPGRSGNRRIAIQSRDDLQYPLQHTTQILRINTLMLVCYLEYKLQRIQSKASESPSPEHTHKTRSVKCSSRQVRSSVKKKTFVTMHRKILHKFSLRLPNIFRHGRKYCSSYSNHAIKDDVTFYRSILATTSLPLLVSL